MDEQPRDEHKEPFREFVKAGVYLWCACGLSKKGPYCDGSHKGTAIKPVRVQIKEDAQVSWCGCKKSGNKPFCDGAHRSL